MHTTEFNVNKNVSKIVLFEVLREDNSLISYEFYCK